MDFTTTVRCGNLAAPGQTLTAANTTILTQLIASVSASAEKLMDRIALSGSQTEYHTVDPGQTVFALRAWPVSALTSIHFDTEQAWGSETEVTAGNYASPVYDRSGLLSLDNSPVSITQPTSRRSALKVVYTGGMAANVAAFIAAYPDIAEAVDAQVVHLYHARNTLGGVVSGSGGSSTPSSTAWLPRTHEILTMYRRTIS